VNDWDFIINRDGSQKHLARNQVTGTGCRCYQCKHHFQTINKSAILA